MQISGPLCRAARALIQLPRERIATLSGLDTGAIAAFETGSGHLDEAQLASLRRALEEGGAVFIAEDHEGGIGVRLKFTARDVRAIARMEGEGGAVGDDDV